VVPAAFTRVSVPTVNPAAGSDWIRVAVRAVLPVRGFAASPAIVEVRRTAA